MGLSDVGLPDNRLNLKITILKVVYANKIDVLAIVDV